MRTLAEHALALIEQTVYHKLAVDDVITLHILYGVHPLLLKLLHIAALTKSGKQIHVALLGSGIFSCKIVENITHTQSVAAYLVGISRSDTLAGGANLSITLQLLVCSIEQAVSRHNQVSLLRNLQDTLNVHTTLLKRLCLFAEQHRVEHHAISYNVDLSMLENARGNRAEHILMSLKFERMTGIRAALEACHHIISRCEDIYNLAFALITPLQS